MKCVHCTYMSYLIHDDFEHCLYAYLYIKNINEIVNPFVFILNYLRRLRDHD